MLMGCCEEVSEEAQGDDGGVTGWATVAVSISGEIVAEGVTLFWTISGDFL